MKEIEIQTMNQLSEYINEFIEQYENDSVLNEVEAIAKKNGWTLGEGLPFVCYNDSERLMFENGKAKVYTKMKPEEVTTLELFADYINEREGWDDSMWDIMERNGWEEADDDSDICHSETELLTFGDNGRANVVPRHDCYHIYLVHHNADTVHIADVDDLTVAKELIAEECSDLIKVDDEHNCSEDVFNSGKVCHYVVFEGDMVNVVDGEPNLNVVYQSDYYYSND